MIFPLLENQVKSWIFLLTILFILLVYYRKYIKIFILINYFIYFIHFIIDRKCTIQSKNKKRKLVKKNKELIDYLVGKNGKYVIGSGFNNNE